MTLQLKNINWNPSFFLMRPVTKRKNVNSRKQPFLKMQ